MNNKDLDVIENHGHRLAVAKGLILSFLVVTSTIPFFFMVPEPTPALAVPSIISTIAGFNHPIDLAFDPVNERMYVTNLGGDNILVVDTDTNTVVGNPIPSNDDSPLRIAYDPEHQRMYVTTTGAGTSVSVISTVSNTHLTNIPLGGRLSGIAYDPVNEKMYVGEVDAAEVTVIDTDTNTIDSTVALPAGDAAGGIAYDPDHHRMYVTILGNPGKVDIIDTTTNPPSLDRVHGPVTVGINPRFGIAYDPVHQVMYVPNDSSASVSVIDTTTTPNVVTETIGSIPGAFGVAYDPVNERMYVTQFLDAGTVSVIDSNTNPPSLISSPIPVGRAPNGIAYDPEHGRMYVANNDGNTVSVIQITSAQTTITSAIDGNGIAVTNGGSTLSDDITFTFSATATAPTTIASFECSLDGSAFAACTSPQTFNNLQAGPHTVDIRAIDESGNREVPPATFTWTTGPPPASSCIGSGTGNTVIRGTNGPDILIGTSGDNTISGLGAGDGINGCGGNDVVSGNTGDDGIAGSSGNDILDGNEGNDIVQGDSGNDRVNGNSGNDRVNGNSGNDVVHGNEGNDIVQGDSGNDQIFGDAGVNTLTGGSGIDAFFCGPNGDTITDFNPVVDTKSGNCVLA